MGFLGFGSKKVDKSVESIELEKLKAELSDVKKKLADKQVHHLDYVDTSENKVKALETKIIGLTEMVKVQEKIINEPKEHSSITDKDRQILNLKEKINLMNVEAEDLKRIISDKNTLLAKKQ